MQRALAAVAQNQMLADGRMIVVSAVNHRDFERQFLVAQSYGQRFPVFDVGLICAHQLELRVGARAQPPVAHE